ncbi:MAG: DUF1802 family protein [Chloroflexi bacterium]|nr:DUF1802 family protein [Chloroflexota bacterium]
MLPNSSHIGLKEWAVTSGALGRGEQIFMLRKGGIREDGRHFKIEHDQFLLYPGLFHEGELLLKQENQHLLEQTANADFSKEITFSVYCKIVEIIEISEEHQVRALDTFHIWSEEFPVKRFNWKPRHPLKLIIVRAYRLDTPTTVAVGDCYAGCKSWVELTDEIDITKLTPALSGADFEVQVSKIHNALASQTVSA